MDSSPKPDIPAITPADTKCVNCGYWLRGLTVDGRCPECGALIKISLNRRLIFNSRNHKIRCLGGPAIWIIGLVLCAACPPSGLYFGRDEDGILAICSLVLLFVGTWLVSADAFEMSQLQGTRLRVYSIFSNCLRLLLLACGLVMGIAAGFSVTHLQGVYWRDLSDYLFVSHILAWFAIFASLLLVPLYILIVALAIRNNRTGQDSYQQS